MADEPVTRKHLQRELVVNAATKPMNIGVPVSVAVAGILTSAPWLLAVAAVVYVALAAMTFFDEDEAAKVGERVYGREDKPRQELEASALMPPIRAQLEAARHEQHAIAKTIEGSDLSWADVRSETGQLVSALEAAARRAQRLGVYLAGQDVVGLERRIGECDQTGETETAAALRTQHAELRRLDEMLRSAYGEMEQVNASLKTVHARLVGAAVTSEAGADADLAGDVRELRERVETLTSGLDTART
jgi:ABC-type phosphate transport system auxiliary subunit